MAFGVHYLFRRRLAAWWTLFGGLALTSLLGWGMHREAVEMDRRRLAIRAAEVQSQLDARLEKSEMLIHNLRDYLMLSGEDRNRVFARWCYENGLSINCPWLHGIAVATNRNEVNWRKELPEPPEKWTAADWAQFGRILRSHPVDCEITLMSEIKEGKLFLPDYSLQRLHRERDALARAVHNSRVAMSEQRLVMQDSKSNKISGTLFYAPIYDPEVGDFLGEDVPSRDLNTRVRWMHLTSLIIAPVDFNELARSVWDGMPSDLGIELFSSTAQSAATWLNSSAGAPRATDPQFKAYMIHSQPWPMYNQTFSIFCYTTPLFEAQSPRRLAKIAMIAGGILTLLAAGLVGVALRARNQQELMTEQIREARDALAAAQKERNKVSRDLHDGTIQSLYAIQLGLGHTVRKIEADPARAGRELSAVRGELDGVIAEIRQFITADLGGTKPVDFGSVLHALTQRAQAGASGKITLHCEPGVSERLSPAQAVQLANIAREALSNSLRHANPQHVHISLRSNSGEVVLEIADDGIGFDPKSPAKTGVGLTSMMSRAREAGATFDIQSTRGQGTSIMVRVPARPEPVEAEEPAIAEVKACNPNA